jgi:hypothetical protein
MASTISFAASATGKAWLLTIRFNVMYPPAAIKSLLIGVFSLNIGGRTMIIRAAQECPRAAQKAVHELVWNETQQTAVPGSKKHRAAARPDPGCLLMNCRVLPT